MVFWSDLTEVSWYGNKVELKVQHNVVFLSTLEKLVMLSGTVTCRYSLLYKWLLFCTAVATNLCHVFCLPHVGGDGSSVPRAVGPLWTGAGCVTVGVIIGVHAVVLIPPPCWLLLQVERKEHEIKLTSTKVTKGTGRKRTHALMEHKHN